MRNGRRGPHPRNWQTLAQAENAFGERIGTICRETSHDRAVVAAPPGLARKGIPVPEQRRRFPLIEVLIVIAIILIVASVIIAMHFRLF